MPVQPVTPKDIFEALQRAGASAVQAAGIMGNMIFESGSKLNPEAAGMDTNGFMSYGLVQWNAKSYPNAAGLVTGNPQADLKKQIDFLAHTGGFQAASGTTVTEAASNFAAQYERCASCQKGGQQNTDRMSAAQQVATWAAAGSWPTSGDSATTTATLTSAQAAEQGKAQESCAWAIGWGGIPDSSFLARIFSLGQSSGNVGSGEVCIVSKTQVRALLGVGLLLGGTGLALWGVQVALVVAALPGASKIAMAAIPASIAGRAAGAAAGAAVTTSQGTTTTASQSNPPRRPKVIQGSVEPDNRELE